MKPLRPGASREEVLAAVADHDRIVDELSAEADAYGDDEIDWRGDPPGRRDGCYWSKDGRVRFHVGHVRDEHPALVRQRLAGEEDQSVPGWDQGA